MRLWRRKKDPEPTDWCVVQELLPFGYRIEVRDLTKAQAQNEVRFAPKYLEPMRIDEVKERNAIAATLLDKRMPVNRGRGSV
jgi:hypothetical protein